MKKQRPSLDGLVPRDSSATLGERHSGAIRRGKSRAQLHTDGVETSSSLTEPPKKSTIARTSIRDSLRQLDDDPEGSPRDRRRQRRAQRAATRPRRRRIVKWIVISIIVIIVGIVGYIGIKAFLATNSIFQGDFFGLIQRQPLKQDANGRSNFLIFGTEAEGHPGGDLTDSVMVLSLNQTTKDAFIVSVPRDLWVDFGATCLSGYQGKINEVYSCYSGGGQDMVAGADALRTKVGEVFGLDVQYYIQLNFSAVVEVVDAVGGVTVTIESEDPRGILDRNFDWVCDYSCYYVNYQNGETVTLDGEHALALARARNASGGYGLPNGNFDREKNQQKILTALREKAISAGTLTNLGKVTGLIDALGNNLRTNIETNEIQTLMQLGQDIPSDSIVSINLAEEEDPIVTTTQLNGQSIVQPVAGLYDYSGIQARIAKAAVNNPISREAAGIVILNATGEGGVAQTEADALIAKGYTIAAVDNAPEGTFAAVEIYQIGEGNTATADGLKAYYGVETILTSAPPVAVSGETSFVVVIAQKRTR